ncbi:DUF397 domain-containing protein [Actinokineospora guangxiensis]|uniref:DUF397 domain-containing protein n=1 Tax=Actinokineospora guangxiensis TaxID=1490288 RepID=A0ABW0EPX7_9PSEU
MTLDLSRTRWRKSSFSGGNGGACVEVSTVGAVRDSKNPEGGVLAVDLRDLVRAVKSGQITA